MPGLTKRKLSPSPPGINEGEQSKRTPRKRQLIPKLPLEMILEIIKWVDVPDQRNTERAMPRIYQNSGGAIFRGVIAYRFPVEAALFGATPDFNGTRKGVQTAEEKQRLKDAVFAKIRFQLQRTLETAQLDITYMESKLIYRFAYPLIAKGGRPFLEFLAELRDCVRLTATMFADIIRSEGREQRLMPYAYRWRARSQVIMVPCAYRWVERTPVFISPRRLRKRECNASRLQEELQVDKDTLYETVLLSWRLDWEKLGDDPSQRQKAGKNKLLLAQNEELRRHYARLMEVLCRCFAKMSGLDQLFDQMVTERLRIDPYTGPAPLTDARWKIVRDRVVMYLLFAGIGKILRYLEWGIGEMNRKLSRCYVARLRRLGHIVPEV